MSNIIVLSGSPRKGGNTDLLVDAFVKGAEKNNDVEVVSVADYKVNPCIGCNSCFDKEGHDCFQQDDMQAVYDKLKCADVIVVASSVYFYGVSAQLKAIIDRLHTPMRNDFKVKKLALILVGAAALPELFDSIKIQYQLVLNFFKLEDAGMVLVRGAKDKLFCGFANWFGYIISDISGSSGTKGRGMGISRLMNRAERFIRMYAIQ